MEQLKIIGTEDDVLVLATESGERFSLPVDDVLRVELRKARREREGEAAREPPEPARDPGAHPRRACPPKRSRCCSARASRTSRASRAPCSPSASTSSARRWPCPCCSAATSSGDAHPTFGSAVRGKLAEAGASGERWTSWKEQTGWIVKLEFTASDVDHDARWGFEPASQHAVAAERRRDPAVAPGFAARRADPATARARDSVPPKDDTRFDSGAFGPRRLPDADLESPELADADRRRGTGGRDQARGRAGRDVGRDRRPARGAASPPRAARAASRPRRRAATAIALSRRAVRRARARLRRDAERRPSPTTRRRPPPSRRRGRRKGRTSMPSWDEIVFGARTED